METENSDKIKQVKEKTKEKKQTRKNTPGLNNMQPCLVVACH